MVTFHPIFQTLEDYCRTCMSRKVRCTCKPISNWNAELIDTTQPDCPNTDNNANKNDRGDGQNKALPLDWSDQDNFWSGKTYDKVRSTALKPVPMPPTMREDEESDWSKNLTHRNYRAKVQSQVSPSNPNANITTPNLTTKTHKSRQ